MGFTLEKEMKHWGEGGLGITNFDIEELPLYEDAIKLYGDPTLFISENIMVPECFLIPENERCLCCTEWKDLSAFWRIFDKLKKKG